MPMCSLFVSSSDNEVPYVLFLTVLLAVSVRRMHTTFTSAKKVKQLPTFTPVHVPTLPSYFMKVVEDSQNYIRTLSTVCAI